jgi:hypothetical protein
MTKLRQTTTALALAAAATALLGAGITTALASVTVYSNDFGSQARYNEIVRAGGGKRCDRSYRKKSQAMRASVKVSPTTCSFRPPVQGDKELPNHQVTVEGKILKETPKSIRRAAFIEVTVRAGGGNTGYSLRVFPGRKRFEFTRGPDGGGFPTVGKSGAIKGINERNALRLAATGAKITASVNGKEVAAAEDGNPGQVAGTKVRFAIGSNSKKRKDTVGTFKRVAVAVPDP